MSVEHEIFHSIPDRINAVEAIVKRIEQKLNASAINRDMLAACKEFVRKVEAGEARSTRSYQQMKAVIARAEAHEGQRTETR